MLLLLTFVRRSPPLMLRRVMWYAPLWFGLLHQFVVAMVLFCGLTPTQLSSSTMTRTLKEPVSSVLLQESFVSRIS
ncbi:UNVERIFIED_CONTAM: hypothetical protein GTU68_045492 [Idotea baltica]|nr:hypothetical protein [Idotea baltica]